MKKPRVLVIYKKSAYQLYVRERRNHAIVKLLASRDPAVERLVKAHQDHVRTLRDAKRVLQKLGIDATFRYRRDAHNGDEVDLVVTLGGDGTLLWASHSVGSRTPMLAINSAPKDSVGFFCAGTRESMSDLIVDALAGRVRATRLTRMRVLRNEEIVSTRILNDVLFCHVSPAATSRYLLQLGRITEEQRSSGVWIGPAAGSTAAQRSAGGKVLPVDSMDLQYVVREAYEPGSVAYALRKGLITPKQTLVIRSKMNKAKLYLDGPHTHMDVALGDVIELNRSPEPLTLLGLRRR